MAFDPESIGIFVATVFTSVGATWGGSKALEKRRTKIEGDTPGFCQEHHKCFQEIKDELGHVREDVAWICGTMGKPKS
jgi:hypothetical protein